MCQKEGALQVQGKLTEQQARTKEAEETVEALKKENAVMKGHGVKLRNAQKEIERLREAWTDKDVQLAEANSNASQQRHVRLLLINMSIVQAVSDTHGHNLPANIELQAWMLNMLSHTSCSMLTPHVYAALYSCCCGGIWLRSSPA